MSKNAPKLTAGGSVCLLSRLQDPIPLYRVGNTEVSRGEVSSVVSEGPGLNRGPLLALITNPRTRA